MFQEAGCDMVLPQGCDDLNDAKVTREALEKHTSYNMSHAAGKAKLTLKQVEELGYTTASFPSAALFAAVGGVKRAMDALKRDRSFAAVEDEICGLEDYYDIVRLKRHNDQEQDWVERGEAIGCFRKGLDPLQPLGELDGAGRAAGRVFLQERGQRLLDRRWDVGPAQRGQRVVLDAQAPR